MQNDAREGVCRGGGTTLSATMKFSLYTPKYREKGQTGIQFRSSGKSSSSWANAIEGADCRKGSQRAALPPENLSCTQGPHAPPRRGLTTNTDRERNPDTKTSQFHSSWAVLDMGWRPVRSEWKGPCAGFATTMLGKPAVATVRSGVPNHSVPMAGLNARPAGSRGRQTTKPQPHCPVSGFTRITGIPGGIA